VVSECKNVSVTSNLIEANDRSGVMFEFLYKGSENITVTNNLIQYNNGYGVEAYSASEIDVSNNEYEGNRAPGNQQKISEDKFIIMQ
jgi:parallel beta-helix repeat protein